MTLIYQVKFRKQLDLLNWSKKNLEIVFTPKCPRLIIRPEMAMDKFK